MEKKKSSIFKNKFMYALAAMVFLFAACKKETPVNNTPVSGLMAINLIPDQPAVDFIMSGNYLTNSPMVYTNYSGTYLSIYSGNRTLGLGLANADTIVSSTNYAFEPSKFYSVFAMGANGHYRNLVVNDNIDSLSTNSGLAFVRYVNAVPDSSKADFSITQNGNNLVNADASFATASDFKSVNPGNLTVTASGENYSVNRTISVEKDKVYTIMLMGIPQATDTIKAVQIKYILNGTVSPNL
ncbi:MAG: DUF4397 domain-containing protein [Ginsengibacter sp.]